VRDAGFEPVDMGALADSLPLDPTATTDDAEAPRAMTWTPDIGDEHPLEEGDGR